MAKLPWMQFYPGDWLLDTQFLSLSTRGLWIDVLAMMWRAEPRTGTLEFTYEAWCKRLRCTDAEFRTALVELECEQVCNIVKRACNKLVQVTSRRIAREENRRENTSLRVKSYRKKKVVTQDETLVKRECNRENQNHISESEVRIRTESEKNQKSESEKDKNKIKSYGQVKTLPAQAKSVSTWEHYAEAYRKRYGVEPKRNHKTNSLLCQLVDRLGADEAPSVAEFYLSHNSPLYVRARHPPDLLVRDAEGLRTQWITGRKVTSSEIRQAEVKDDASEQVKRVEAMLQKGLT